MKCLWVLAICALAAANEPRIVWDFENGPLTWRPRAKTITLTLDADKATAHGGAGSLHVAGSIADNWNYATSDTHPMAEGGLYRLTAHVRVHRVGDGTPAPYLKCEFVPDKGKPDLGRATTGPYDRARLDTWQELSVEFRAPAGTRQFWLAIEKGTDGPCELDLHLDDVAVEPIQELTALARYRLDPLPKSLAAARGVHPRLFLNAEAMAALKGKCATTHAALAALVLKVADEAAREGPPAYRDKPDRSGDEQLWQRNVGNRMPDLAIAWRATGQRKYLDAAKRWALASCGYPTWGLGRTDGMDLAAGHQLLGLALVYDWCYADLDEPTRTAIRQTLVRRAGAMFDAAATGAAWWRQSYLQNHLWVNAAGLAAAGLAIFDEHEPAVRWVGLALEKFRTTMRSLGPDGASHEGVGYWGYGVEYMLKFMHLARSLLDVDLYDSPWWRNAAAYRLYLALPRNAWTRSNCIVDIADCPRGNWYGPDYLLRRLAAEYRDGHAQWLAQQINDARVQNPDAEWLNLVWYDPSLQPTAPADLPTLRHFADMGIVSMRSGWSGDESLAVFKCGPFIGHEAVAKFRHDPGGGHVHPDANHFVLFGGGEWLIRDDGYSAKWTGQHNTLLVGGAGQIGEGHEWFNGAPLLGRKDQPSILRAEATEAFDHVAGDAAAAYPAAAGLKRFVRHLLFIKPDVLIVADDIELDRPRRLELRFHTENEAAGNDDGAFLARGRKTTLRIEPMPDADVQATAGWVGGKQIAGEREAARLFTISLSCTRRQWRSAVAFTWCPVDETPAAVEWKADADRLRVVTTHGTFVLDWRTGVAKKEEP